MKLRNVVYEKTGLGANDRLSAKLDDVVALRIRTLGLRSAGDYIELLESRSPRSTEEIEELVSLLTTGETFFFRDKGQIAVLEQSILPSLIREKQKSKELRIWSAGCSSGEEPYSLAIALDRLIPDRRHWKILLIGTDINERALEKARAATYGSWSFRGVAPEVMSRYFRKHGKHWELEPDMRAMVRFQAGNLLRDSFPSRISGLHDMDLVICRNVLIYMEPPQIQMLIHKFVKTLALGGYLVAGHGELHSLDLGELRAVPFPEGIVYQRSGHHIRKTEIKPPPLKARPHTLLAHPAPPKPAAARARTHVPTDLTSIEAAARRSADAGDYDEALRWCRKALDLDSLSPRIYYLWAHIVLEKREWHEAKTMLKKVMYLDPHFIPAYIELAAIYRDERQPARARKLLESALEQLNHMASKAEVGVEGFTAGDLLSRVQASLASIQ